MSTITGRITNLTIAGNTFTNCKFLRWNSNHNLTPQFLPSTKYPVGYLQSHIDISGEIGLLTQDSNLVAPSTVDGEELAMSATGITTDGVTFTVSFTGVYIESVSMDLGGAEPIFVYTFRCKYFTTS